MVQYTKRMGGMPAQECTRNQVRIRELDESLAGVTLTDDDVNGQAQVVEVAEADCSDLSHRVDAGANQLEKRRLDCRTAEALRRETAVRSARHALVHQLSRDLKSDCFQQFLLEGSFRRLVEGASLRLRELNERYELNFVDGRFAVVDHDNRSLSRLADTLSGGETFLVSLALALELSEQVQRVAGAVRLDSLFIDEGFGTLDPETLESVAEAIETLGRTNRMVGVITHVAELHRRLPRLEVRPAPSGSTVVYVED